MKKYVLYDLEIIKAIPGKSKPIDGIEYCGGWGDHSNMGISVIGFCDFFVFDHDAFVIGDPQYVIGDEYGLQSFKQYANQNEGIIGFNSKNFDDKVMSASGFSITTNYDLLDEVRLAAYGSKSFQDAPQGHSYKLGLIAAVNKCSKTGDGANAAIEWQQGMHKKVIEYCMNDVAISAKILKLGLEGKLKDPNTGKMLQLRSL
jgi:hypothetical protein